MDEEASVETVDDAFMTEKEFQRIHPVPEPQEPSLLWIVLGAYLSNPWFILLLGICFYYLYQKIKPSVTTRWAEWQENRQLAEEAAQIKKNPDLYRSKMEAMDKARRNLQEKYDQDAQAAVERRKAQDEEKRKKTIEELENLAAGKGYRNKIKVEEAEFSDGVRRTNGSAAKKKPSFKPEYNPLMGNGGSGGFRPSRRSNNAGG